MAASSEAAGSFNKKEPATWAVDILTKPYVIGKVIDLARSLPYDAVLRLTTSDIKDFGVLG